MKLGEPAKAARVLSRRRDLGCLEIASQLAFITGDKEFGASLAEEAIARALTTLDYSKARSILANIQQFQVHMCGTCVLNQMIKYIYNKQLKILCIASKSTYRCSRSNYDYIQEGNSM